MNPERKSHPEIEPDIRPNLHVVQGGRESTPERGNLQEVDNSTAQDLSNQERQFGLIQGGGESTPERGNLKSASDNIDKTREKEAGWNTSVSANNKSTKKQGIESRLKGLLKKQGPAGTIGALLLGAGGGLGFFGMTLMPVTIAEHFTNDTNDVNASSQRKTTILFGKKLGGDLKKKLSICTKAVSVRCKFNTLDPKLVEKFEKKGFKFGEKTEAGDGKRIGFTSVEFPDGQIAHNAQELSNLLKNSAVAASAFNSVYSIKNSLFIVGNFFKGVLTKLNLTKGKKVEGKNRAEADKSFEESTKGEKGTVSTSAVADDPGKDATEEEKKNAQSANDTANETSREINESISKGTKLSKLSLKLTNALAIPQLACLTINMGNYIATAAKIKKALRFAAFAMIFLTYASSLKANAATDAETEKVMSVVAPSKYPTKVEDPDTGEMIDNPNIGKNALDAEAYKVVAYGDQINLTGLAARFFIASGVFGFLEKVLTWIDQKIGKENIKLACKAVNNKVVQAVSFLAAPVFTPIMMGAMALITTVFPVEKWAAELVNAAIDAAAGPDLTTDVVGPDAGNVVFIGAAMIMGTSAMKFGLKPGKLSAIKQNMADNNELIQQDIAMRTYEASKTPLDVTNRYSFLGGMATSLASYMPSLGSPLVSTINKTFAAIPGSLSMLTKNANAAYSMPVANYSDNRFKQCSDDAYKALEKYMDPDMFCVVRYTPFKNVDSDVVIDYMTSSMQIDDNGAPVPDSYLDKYTKYCVNREDPWGSTSVAAEEQKDDATWYTGEKCMEDNKDNQMSSEYTGYKVLQDTMDGGSSASSAFLDDSEQDTTVASDMTLTDALVKGMAYAMGGAK